MQRLMRSQVEQTSQALPLFVDACRSGKQYPAIFRKPILNRGGELICRSIALQNKMLSMMPNLKITNVADANKYLNREYRKGWEPIRYNVS